MFTASKSFSYEEIDLLGKNVLGLVPSPDLQLRKDGLMQSFPERPGGEEEELWGELEGGRRQALPGPSLGVRTSLFSFTSCSLENQRARTHTGLNRVASGVLGQRRPRGNEFLPLSALLAAYLVLQGPVAQPSPRCQPEGRLCGQSPNQAAPTPASAPRSY